MNNNPLDDTRTGRITQALAIAAYTATPDYVHSNALRVLTRISITTTALATIAYANLHDDNPDNDPQVVLGRVEAELAAGDRTLSPAKTYLSLLGICLGGWGVAKLDWAVTRRIASALRRIGVSKPHTVLGVAAGAAVYATSLSEVRG